MRTLLSVALIGILGLLPQLSLAAVRINSTDAAGYSTPQVKHRSDRTDRKESRGSDANRETISTPVTPPQAERR